VTTAVRAAIADSAEADSLVDEMPLVEVTEPDEVGFGYKKLSSLIEGDFPFDEASLMRSMDSLKRITPV
jgi:hypothetical protein